MTLKCGLYTCYLYWSVTLKCGLYTCYLYCSAALKSRLRYEFSGFIANHVALSIACSLGISLGSYRSYPPSSVIPPLSFFAKREREREMFVGCLTSQQHASVSQGRIFTDNFTCCHTEIEAADQTFYLTQSQYTDTGPTSPSADPITPGAWQGSYWSANF